MRRALFAVALSLVAGSAMTAATKHRKPTTHTVIMEAMQFRPAVLTVKSGDSIVWVNKDLVEHTATATGHFDSKMIRPAKSWTTTIRSKGIVPYVCTYHPTMKGTLEVK